MTIKRNRYSIFLFEIVFFFLILDGVRSNIIYNEFISPIKELSILLLFIETFRVQHKTNLVNILGIPMLLFFIYHCIISFISLIFSDPNLISNTLLNANKFSLYFLLTISLYHYEEITHQPFERVYKSIILYAVIYSVINLLSVFVPLPIWKEKDIWFGRFSIGYPTSDTISLCFSLIILLYKPLYKSFIKKYACITIIIINIIMQVTGSALILLPTILLIYIFTQLHKNFIKSIYITSLNLFLLFIILIFIGRRIESTFEEQFANAQLVFSTKIDNFIKGEETGNFDSKTARINQYKHASKHIKNPFNDVAGIGIEYFTMDGNKLTKYKACFHIENMFYVIKICYGIVGLVLYIIFFAISFIKIVRIKTSLKEKAFLMSLLAICLVPNTSLVALYLIQIYGTMAFFTAYIGKKYYKKTLNTIK